MQKLISNYSSFPIILGIVQDPVEETKKTTDDEKTETTKSQSEKNGVMKDSKNGKVSLLRDFSNKINLATKQTVFIT